MGGDEHIFIYVYIYISSVILLLVSAWTLRVLAGEPGGLRNAGMESFPATQRRTSPVHQPVYGFQGSPVYPMEDASHEGDGGA